MTNSTGKKILALFDFDGTLTKGDTFIRFHVFFHGWMKFLWACGGAFLQGCRAGRCDRDFLKAALASGLWKDAPLEDYRTGARRYAELHVEKLLLPQALSVFLRHVEHGHEVFIVTASMKDWIEPWASKYRVPVVGTELESAGGKLTGRLATPNCRGPEKVRRISEVLNLKSYEKIYAYGNSRGDVEMLALADEKVYNWDRIPQF